jgi:hypothetical protein
MLHIICLSCLGAKEPAFQPFSTWLVVFGQSLTQSICSKHIFLFYPHYTRLDKTMTRRSDQYQSFVLSKCRNRYAKGKRIYSLLIGTTLHYIYPEPLADIMTIDNPSARSEGVGVSSSTVALFLEIWRLFGFQMGSEKGPIPTSVCSRSNCSWQDPRLTSLYPLHARYSCPFSGAYLADFRCCVYVCEYGMYLPVCSMPNSIATILSHLEPPATPYWLPFSIAAR